MMVSIAFISYTASRSYYLVTESTLLDLHNIAGQEGLEPPTVGFGDRCSTN